MPTLQEELRSELLAYDNELSEYETWLNERESRLQSAGLLPPPDLFRPTLDQTPDLDFLTIDPDGTPVLHVHRHQLDVLESAAPRVVVCAGWRSGKSSCGPPWMARRMRAHGPGDYLLAAPSFGLLDKFPVPAIDKFLGRVLGLGEVIGQSKGEFRVSEAGHRKLWPESKWPAFDPRQPSRIIFGHAENPDSLAAATILDAWLDEPDQKRFRKESHDEILARLATTGGHVLYTTRPYRFGWFKEEVYDRGIRNREARRRGLVPMPVDAGYEVIEFESIDNPKFSKEEDARAKATLPDWVYLMKFKGRFTKPAGVIYDCYVDDYPVLGGDGRWSAGHLLPGKDFELPADWPLYAGHDFGAPNFAATFFYEDMVQVAGSTVLRKSGKLVAFAEYVPKESRTAAQHVAAMRAMVGRLPNLCVGGAKSEGQWRSEFAAAGWPIREPDQKEVEVGIQRVYAAISSYELFVMDTLTNLRQELRTYAREVDDVGEPISDTIADKETFHVLDSVRYIISFMRRTGGVARAYVAE